MEYQDVVRRRRNYDDRSLPPVRSTERYAEPDKGRSVASGEDLWMRWCTEAGGDLRPRQGVRRLTQPVSAQGWEDKAREWRR
ncbi:MAG: hypothetical protein M3N68_07540 [Actinomycetota bacterium]|nr:hypothetical protein [Actinomycetota bacterium]